MARTKNADKGKAKSKAVEEEPQLTQAELNRLAKQELRRQRELAAQERASLEEAQRIAMQEARGEGPSDTQKKKPKPTPTLRVERETEPPQATKKKKKGSKVGDNPYGIEWKEKTFAKRYDRFVEDKKTLIPSRFIDILTLNALGLYNDVWGMVSFLNLWPVLSVRALTYYSLTVEFFCTVEFHFDEPIHLTFYLRGERYSLSLSVIAAIFGIPQGAGGDCDWEDWDHEFNHNDFVQSITGRHYDPNLKKSSLIQHPAIRYVQRILGFTIFARGETVGTMIRPETFFLYCMLYRDHHNQPMRRPNIPLFWMHSLHRVITNHAKEQGKVSIGGLVTKIYNWFDGGWLDHADVVPGDIILDIPGMMRANILVRQHLYHIAPPYFATLHDHEPVELPLPYEIDYVDRNTWLIEWLANPLIPEEQDEQQGPGEAGIAALSEQLAAMQAFSAQHFGSLADSYAGINQSFATVNDTLGTYQSHFEEIDNNFAEVNTRFDNIDNRLGYLTERQQKDTRRIRRIYRHGRDQDHYGPHDQMSDVSDDDAGGGDN